MVISCLAPQIHLVGSHTQITVFYSHCENDTNSNERKEGNYVASLKASRTEIGRESNMNSVLTSIV